MAVTQSGSGNDGAGNVSARTSGVINFGSAKSNQLYILCVTISWPTNAAGSVTSVTDTEGNTWHLFKREAVAGFTTSMSGGPKAGSQEVWYTTSASSPANSTTFTTNFSGTIDSASWAFVRFDGVALAAPFDANASIPAVSDLVNNGTAVQNSVSLSTSTTHAMVIQSISGIGASQGSFNGTIAGSSSLDFSNNGTNFANVNAASMRVGGKAFTTTQSGISLVGAQTQNNSILIGFALTSDAQAPSGTLAATDPTDTFHDTGYAGYPGSRGDLVAVEAKDVFAAVGYPNVNGAFNGVETKDAFSAFGTSNPVKGPFNVTEATDIFSAIGEGRGVDAAMAVTEAPDIFAATGSVPFVGSFTPTETPDRFLAIGGGVQVSRRRRTMFVT